MRAVPDPRCGRETKHDHAEVLVCLTAGFLAGRTTIRRSLKWCGKHLSELREYLPLKNGIASPPTACRILSGIDEELFAMEFMEWVGEIACTKGIHLAVDGKALRAAMEKVKDFRAPMVLNAIDAVTGLVIAQVPIQNKDCEIKAIPELLKLLDIQGSTVTTDAVGTQTQIMEQIISQEGHFVLMVKKNQPQSYDEIMKYFGEMREDHKKMKEDREHRPRHPEMQEKYEEVCRQERNRDRQEYRWYSVCTECALLTRTQKEWPFVKTVGLARQIRIPVERDAQGNDITPDIKTFLEKGSRRRPKPVRDEEMGKDIQVTGMISDMELTAEEIGRIKREHWAIENRLHHILDDTFREDRSPAKRSKNNLALIRKFAYNILRMAILSGDCSEIMTEAMDDFCDDPLLRKKYVFNGIASFY
ncbi:MAG: ISAs1 family transposase [Acetatifactor sp.]|nr:ISAs1 family transposase [Acetatifactor sp.]